MRQHIVAKRLSDATNPNAAQKRVRRLKAQSQQSIREGLRSAYYVSTIEKICEIAPTLDKEQVPGYRLQLDAAMGLLKKCLPDLKQIEVSGQVQHFHEKMTQAEIHGVLLSSGLDPEAVFKQLQ